MKNALLGQIPLTTQSFAHLDSIFEQFHDSPFTDLSVRKRFKQINKVLLETIQKEKEPCFLLPAVLAFIERVNRENLLVEPYRFISFEFWLNHFSGLSFEENYQIRGKIIGKFIPREEYQELFPIGMGKVFHGSHFVAAHISPDVDTTIASFWGWVDAFGAKVADGVHQWSLPGVVTDSHVVSLFKKIFNQSVFELLTRPTIALTLTALDLVTEKDLVKVHAQTRIGSLDHTHADKSIILIDDTGHFCGDWRVSDVEAVRQIVLLFNSCIRWFENNVHVMLINLFAKKSIHLHDITKALETIFAMTMKQSDPVKEFTERQKKHQNDYLAKILYIHTGLNVTFRELMMALDTVTKADFDIFKENLESLTDPLLFDSMSRLIEDRPRIFSRLEKIISSLDICIQKLRNYIDRLDVMLEIKDKVLGIPPQFITLKSDVDEIRNKMDNLEHLTVVIPEEGGKFFPVGIVQAGELKKSTLGTVSLRDFCNNEEVVMASYLEVISVIDHHKSDIKTVSVPMMIIGDVQSSNTLVSEICCKINERYSTLGMSLESIEKQLAAIPANTTEQSALRKLGRLIQLKLNAHTAPQYFIDPQREYIEYFCFINAILDDTDLLTKVSNRDVECIVRLLNKMKSIALQQDMEVISLEEIPKDEKFAITAAQRILQNEEMYSIYKKIYELKEEEVEKQIIASVTDKPAAAFGDTKEQNGCCRVGQTKIFQKNYPLFAKHANALRKVWYESVNRAFEANLQIDLHLHMISTITGAEEAHTGSSGNYEHKDEIWIWSAPTTQGREHLINFLNGFSTVQAVQQNTMEVEFCGDNAEELNKLFAQDFSKGERTTSRKQHLPIAIIRFKAGLINSRKAMITPYLPRYIS